TSVADARTRALTKAEDALTRIRNGLGGRYYKTQQDVDAKVATILGKNISGLLHVTTGTHDGKPTLDWHRDTDAIPAARRLAGLHLTHTPTGPILDPLTEVQRTILAHLAIPLPWPEQQSKQENT